MSTEYLECCAANRTLHYIVQQEDTTPANVLLLRRLQNMATKKKGACMKQKPIKQFFMILRCSANDSKCTFFLVYDL